MAGSCHAKTSTMKPFALLCVFCCLASQASARTVAGSKTSLSAGLQVAVGAGGYQDPYHGATAENLDLEAPAILSGTEMAGEHAIATTRDVATFIVAPCFGVLLFCIVVDTTFHKLTLTHLIPSSVWIIVCSSILGLVARYLLDSGSLTQEHITFGLAGLLNLFLLPIIIFASGWTLNHKYFLKQLEYILVFAVLGTLITFFLIATFLSWLGRNGYTTVTGVRENLVFAALISAIDPVATLSTFGSLGIDQAQPLLHNMIFGESVVNDAVAISLFNCINHISYGEMTMGYVVYEICSILILSAVLGFLLSCFLVVLLRFATNAEHFTSEVIYIASCAWFIYAMAEALHTSGIIANLVAGSVFKLYGSHHLTVAGRQPTENALRVGGEMCDTMVFMICGVCCGMLTPGKGLPFIGFSIVLCLMARGVSVSLCAAVSNGIKRLYGTTNYINAKHQVVMWHAGLRGGIALVLALEIDADWCTHKATIINATFSVICFTLLVFGSTTKIMLDMLGFEYPDPAKVGHGGCESTVPELPSRKASESELLFRNRLCQAVHQVLAKVLVGEEKGKEVKGVSREVSGMLSPVARVLTRE
mmetsp:Transcript_69172/g.165864  ORF Transcript_69172/g.165864 Transcript_69172/m.165864 type:complete len:590 (-) Transcript_69172:49-1818(-)